MKRERFVAICVASMITFGVLWWLSDGHPLELVRFIVAVVDGLISGIIREVQQTIEEHGNCM